MRLFVVGFVLTVYLVYIKAQEDENFEGLESFIAKQTIPRYTIERKPLLNLLSKVGLKYICPGGGSCPGFQPCCKSGSGYGCCPYELVSLS